jgi:hypothetical protein
MKSLVFSDNVRQSKELYELAQQANALLEEVLGPSADLVSAEWERSKDAKGRDLLNLRIADWSGSESAIFAPLELKETAGLRWRLNRLWGDLLQTQSHKLLDKLLQTSATPEE